VPGPWESYVTAVEGERRGKTTFHVDVPWCALAWTGWSPLSILLFALVPLLVLFGSVPAHRARPRPGGPGLRAAGGHGDPHPIGGLALVGPCRTAKGELLVAAALRGQEAPGDPAQAAREGR